MVRRAPGKRIIAKRYLKHRMSYAREALARLTEDSPQEIEPVEEKATLSEESIEKKLNLNETRLAEVLQS